MEGIRMETMDALDCPNCHEPLGPLIFQCGNGHLLCRPCLCLRIKREKCPSPLCPSTTFVRCFAMERVANAIKVPCCFTKNGCTEKMAYFSKAKHERACQHGPCFCPEPGCGFTGSTADLRDHFAGRHKWPSTAFEYYARFDLRLKPGPHVLHAQDGTSVFLVNVAPAAEPLGHAISLVCVQPQPEVSTDSKKKSMFGLSLIFSCFTGHHQVLTLEDVRSSSLADGLPKEVVCFVPRTSGDDDTAMLSITLDTELAFDDTPLEDDNINDKDYEEGDDEEDDGDKVDEDEEEDGGEDDEEDDGDKVDKDEEEDGEDEEEKDGLYLSFLLNELRRKKIKYHGH